MKAKVAKTKLLDLTGSVERRVLRGIVWRYQCESNLGERQFHRAARRRTSHRMHVRLGDIDRAAPGC